MRIMLPPPRQVTNEPRRALAGRDHVLPDDVQAMAVPVLAHRLLLTPDATLARRDAQRVVTDLLTSVPVHRGR